MRRALILLPIFALPGLFLFACPGRQQLVIKSDAGAVPVDASAPHYEVPANCDFGGQGSQAFGQDCGCVEDCAVQPALCTHNPQQNLTGPDYCTQECADDGDCPESFGCLSQYSLFGMTPFCQRCASETPHALGIDDPCICDSDCGQYDDNGRQLDMACISGRCAISPCSLRGARACPENFTCEGQPPLSQSHCVLCINLEPAQENSQCACAYDCQAGLKCEGGVCRRPCSSDASCGENQECRQQASGGGLCTDVSSRCSGDGSLGIGAMCNCNADCSAEAPDCVTLQISSFPVSMCTIRPCNLMASEACPSGQLGAFQCCMVPLVMPETCVPGALASVISSYGLCSQ